VIAAVRAVLDAFICFSRMENANDKEVSVERFLAKVVGIVLEMLLIKIFGIARSGVTTVDMPSRFYVLWHYNYKASEMDPGEAIIFTYGQKAGLFGQDRFSTWNSTLVEKKKEVYHD